MPPHDQDFPLQLCRIDANVILSGSFDERTTVLSIQSLARARDGINGELLLDSMLSAIGERDTDCSPDVVNTDQSH